MRNLYRSRTNRVIAGIFGGMGESYRVDPNLLRIIYVILALFTGILPAVLLYLIAWAVIPEQSTVTMTGAPPSP